jgi:thioredoxin 1
MSEMIHVEDANFEQEVLKSDRPVLVDFWAEWCAPCRMIGPIVEELANEYNGKAKIVKVNVDKADRASSDYAVTSIPTLIVFKGGKAIDKVVGAVSKNKIKGMIDSALS